MKRCKAAAVTLKNRVRLFFMILEGGGAADERRRGGGGEAEWPAVTAFALVLTFPSQSAANLCLFYADETQTAPDRSTPLNAQSPRLDSAVHLQEDGVKKPQHKVAHRGIKLEHSSEEPTTQTRLSQIYLRSRSIATKTTQVLGSNSMSSPSKHPRTPPEHSPV